MTTASSLQPILQSCPWLETLDVAAHEIDMDLVDMSEWICKDLKTLRIRVRVSILRTTSSGRSLFGARDVGDDGRRRLGLQWRSKAISFHPSFFTRTPKDTNTPSSTAKTNPFNLPALRHRISAHVSNAWSATFVPIVWYEVDFSSQARFAGLSPNIINKYGQHIRIVKNAKIILEVTAVATEGVTKLTSLYIKAGASVMHHIRAYEIVSGIKPKLEYLRLFAASESANGQASLAHFVSASPLITFSSPLLRIASKLTVLRIERLYLTREGLMSILQASPELNKLTLISTVLVGSARQSIQHPGVKTLAAGIKCLFHGDPTPGKNFQRFQFLRPRSRRTWPGLDTKESIPEAIALWRKECWRRRQKETGILMAAEEQEDQMDLSIVARVARHLLKFEKLRSVWLGYQTWRPI
ncbi:hypothetical protein BGZ47_010640 [Haplosporangium gracile]|nr:hypothetical protein BGZ47_010640 [Haplosporangium gracile]